MLKIVKTQTPPLMITVALVCLTGAAAFMLLNMKDVGPIDTFERDRYLTLEFVPKYKSTECVVTFDFFSHGKSGYLYRDADAAFTRYLSKYEPKTGTTVLEPTSPENQNSKGGLRYMLAFADQCDRKEEIFLEMAEYAEDYLDDEITIERVPNTEPFKMVANYWLDSIEYDPDYWPTLHKAYRGDGKALLKLPNFLKQNNHDGKHSFYALAEHFLPEGPLKEEARIKKEAEYQQMFPNQQARIQKAFEYNIEMIQRYSAP